jgi:hypothetical protein
MIHVEITDKDLWYYFFVNGMMDIFFERDETKRTEMMFNFFRKLLDEKSDELDKHFKKFYPGRYKDSDEGTDLRNGIEERHDSALSKAIRKFPEEYWLTVIADMIMWFFKENKLSDTKKIVHEVIIPAYSGEEDPNDFKCNILGYLETRLHLFPENEKETIKIKAGF